MRCLVCDSTNKWKNVDHLRMKKEGMSMCVKCGFVSYPDKYKTKEEIEKYYEKDYRTPPSANNLYTSQKKMQYHAEFLKDTIIQWKKEGKKPVVTDIGAAYGVYLYWFKQMMPEADINGTEWTLSFRRNAYHEFGVKLDKDFDETKKYDLISSYKVAEHMMDADEELKRYHDCLNDDGFLYVSVPTWFDYFYNFGTGSQDIEYYYHPDHINVWTRKLFETVLAKAGFEIVKHNDTYYDDTYLCKKRDSKSPIPEAQYENPEEIEKIMASIKESSDNYISGKFKESISAFPKSPLSYRQLYERSRADLDKLGWDEIKKTIDSAVENCKRVSDIYVFAADVCIRYKKYELALGFIEQALDMKPNNTAIIKMQSMCIRQLALMEKDPDKKIFLFKKARDAMRFILNISDQGKDEAITWIYSDNAEIPFPGE